MSIDINILLKGATALPYEESIVVVLKKSCEDYLSEDICQKADDLTPAFVYGQINENFKNYITSKLSDAEYKVALTDEVICRLSEYAVVSSIQNEADEEKQAFAATIMMNYMLVAKGRFSKVSNTDYVKSVYAYHISKYLDKVDTAGSSVMPSVYEEFVQRDPANGDFTCSADSLSSLQCALKESLLYKINMSLRHKDIQCIEDPYVRVFVGLQKVMNLLPYKYYNLGVTEMISTLLHDSEKTRRKFGNIISSLKDAEMNYAGVQFSSSVILSVLNGNENLYPSSLKDLLLPVREYAIYLYYEMLTELIGNK